MKALTWHGKHDIRCETVPDPKVEDAQDAIIKVTACAICGSDLHIFDGVIPSMEKGDIVGHETMVRSSRSVHQFSPLQPLSMTCGRSVRDCVAASWFRQRSEIGRLAPVGCPAIDVVIAGARVPDMTSQPIGDRPVFALNLFDLADREEYLAYSRRSAREVVAHGGRVVALGQFREAVVGDVSPRQVMIVVEWESRAAFENYRNDPALSDLHPHRENGTSSYIWHLFDRLDDLRPLLRQGDQ